MPSLNKFARAALVAVALLLSATGSAHAALVNFEFTGTVSFASGYGGLSIGDPVTVQGIFDDSVLSGGSGTVDFWSGNGNTLTITAGTYSFTAANDSAYSGSDGPFVTLSSGALTYFDYSATNGTNGAPADFDSFNLSFIADAALTGDWNPEVQISAVPVPAAIWLFGSGLLGLVGVTIRRRKNTE